MRARQTRRTWIIVMTLVLAGLVVLALIRTTRDAPARSLRGELPGVGPILVTLRLTPDPPRVGHSTIHVQVNEIAGAPIRGAVVATTAGSETGLRQRVVLELLGGGGHQGAVMLPEAGSWWFDVEVIGDAGAARLRFLVEVLASM
ncbi:MAG: hypothetical protein QN178_04825 [Armatimonadota bacterium]|nr:hypothetical protein [Armatimonadota bacterium]